MNKPAKVVVTGDNNINIESIDEPNIKDTSYTGNNNQNNQQRDHGIETDEHHDVQDDDVNDDETEEARAVNRMFGGNSDSDDDEPAHQYNNHNHNYNEYGQGNIDDDNNYQHDQSTVYGDHHEYHGHGYHGYGNYSHGNMYGVGGMAHFYHSDNFILSTLSKLNLSKYSTQFSEFNITEQALQHLDGNVVEFLINDEKDRDKFLKWLMRYKQIKGIIKIEFNLDELKILINNIKDPVFGYIRECQAILPHHINPYYNIPELIRWLILFYYHFMCDEKLSDTDFLKQILESDGKFEMNADLIFDDDDVYDDMDDMDDMMITAETPTNISGDEIVDIGNVNQHKDVVIDNDTKESKTSNLNENHKLIEMHDW